MSIGASKLIKVTTKYSNHPCICGIKACGELSACFQSIGDARGCKFVMPVLDGERGADIKLHKLKTICHHLSLGKDNYRLYGTNDKRDRKTSTPSPAKNTRKKKSTATREISVVAAHHFHPQVVRYMVQNEKVKFKDYIPESFIKNAGLLEKGYTDIDYLREEVKGKDGKTEKKPALMKVNGVKEKVFAPTPSYKEAWGDYQLVATRFQINDIIQNCNDATYGHSFLRKRDDGVIEPVHKMAKPSADDPDDLRRAICVVTDDLNEMTIKNKKLKQQLEEEKTRNNNAAIEQYVQGRKNGLTRLNISSDKYHQSNPKVAKLYFKFQDTAKGSTLSCWDVTKQFLKDMFDVDHEEPTIDKIQDSKGRAKRLTEFETCLVALIFFQNGYDHQFIGSIFGCTRQLVGRCIRNWAPSFREVGYHMARLELTKDFLDKCYPQSYKDLDFTEPVCSVKDGTDVLVETVRINRAVNVVMASNKVHSSAVRGCTWSTPTGTVHEFSDPVFARASEKAIVRWWAGYGRFKDMPIGYLVSADKGFDGTSGFYPHYNPVMHPAFLTGGNGAQFTEEQINWNRKACEMRYTSEVVYSRFKQYCGLGGIVPRHHLPYLRDMWAWAHGMANYYNCLQVPADNTYFPESKYSRKK